MSGRAKKSYRNIEDGWIDVTAPLEDGMTHWPGDAEISVTRMTDMKKGDACNLSRISMTAHAGTHMDAPSHFTGSKKGIDRIPLSSQMGRARVIGIHDTESVKVAELKPYRIRKGERILFKTRNSRRKWHMRPFDENFVYISTEAALFLAGRGVRTVGVDYLSVGGPENGAEVHVALLKKGVCIVEGLYLQGIEPGDYELVCLPLKVKGGDGAPCRALVRPL